MNQINLQYLQGYSGSIIYVINFFLVPGLMAVALITFLYGVYRYFILGAANEDDRKVGRQFVLWGIIGFVVIVSVWGLVFMVSWTLGVGVGGAFNLAPKPPVIFTAPK